MRIAVFLLAQTETAQGASPFVSLLPLAVIFGIFYLVLFAPMRKRQKALQKVVQELKRGDRVVTNGGLLGEVSAVEDKAVLLKLADNVRVRVLKSAIAGLEELPGQETPK